VFRPAAHAAPLPPEAAWLSGDERARAASFRFEKRRLDWLRGRLAAKEAVAALLRAHCGEPPPLAWLQVDADDAGAPYVRLASEAGAHFGWTPGQTLPVSVSISHAQGAVFCVAAPGPAALGGDVERVEPRAPSFVADFFTAAEATACARGADRDTAVTAVWCGKEAVLKALRLGLRVDARDVVCVPRPARGGGFRPDTGWLPLRVLKAPAASPASRIRAWWRAEERFVRAVAIEAGAARGRA
jgi:4'-phosphopantetheinyl transferase